MAQPRSWRALGWRFTAELDVARLGSHITTLLDPLACELAAESTYRAHRVSAGQYVLTLDEAPVAEPIHEQALADLLLWSVNQEIVSRTRGSVLIHAATLAQDGVGVILPGTSGSGKSTLSAVMVTRGFDYLTDEATAIGVQSGTVESYHRPIALKPGSWSMFPDAAPAPSSDGLRFSANTWHVDPRTLRPDCLVPTAQPSVVVFPTYRSGRPVTSRRLRPAETAVRLATNSMNLRIAGQAGLERLAALSAAAPGYELQYDASDHAVEAIRTFLAA